MSLSRAQGEFSENLGKLIKFIYLEAETWEHPEGYYCSIREVQRFPERQKKLVEEGLSKTLNSDHLKSLAVDIVLFDEETGQYLRKLEDYKQFGKYWKYLHEKNYWGGDWKSPSDGNHFGRKQ